VTYSPSRDERRKEAEQGWAPALRVAHGMKGEGEAARIPGRMSTVNQFENYFFILSPHFGRIQQLTILNSTTTSIP
jgi:hypothetical protein